VSRLHDLFVGRCPESGPGSADERTRSRVTVPEVAVAIVLGASFVALAVAMAWERPLCCVDDALYGVVAKNVANGHGYVPTFGPFLGQPFAPWVGTGPTSILPAAAAIAIFGSDARVPGLAHVGMWLCLLALAVRASARLGARPWVLLATFLALQLATSGWHFEQWYALLGEVPAALLVVLGTALLVRDDAARRHAVAGGLAFGAATLGKLLAALYLVGPLLWLGAALLRRPKSAASAGGGRALAFAGGFLAPHGAFELWKLAVLGVPGWWDNLRWLAAFVIQYGAGNAPAVGLGELAHRAALLDRHFVFAPLLFACSAVLAGLALRHLPRAANRFVLFLFLGVGLHLLYWMLLSSGRARYACVAAVVWSFAFAFLAATIPRSPLRLGLAALLAWTLAVGLPRLDRSLGLLAQARRPGTSHIVAARAMAAAIRALPKDAPIAAQNWSSVTALEYLAEEPGRFRIPPDPEQRQGWVVVDDRVLERRDAGFARLLAACETVARHPPYTLERCSDRDDE
jgi:hypothetical protein